MKISELSVDYVSFDDDGKEISGIAISYKDNSGKEQRRWLEKPRRIGHWIEELGNVISCRCSICDHSYNLYEDDINGYPYCAWCGAKMDESEV